MHNPAFEPFMDRRSDELHNVYGDAPTGFVADDGRDVFTTTFSYNPPFVVATVTWGEDSEHLKIGVARCEGPYDALQAAGLALEAAFKVQGLSLATEELPDGAGAELLRQYSENAETAREERRQFREAMAGGPQIAMRLGDFTDQVKAIVDASEDTGESTEANFAEWIGAQAAHNPGEWPEPGCPECEGADGCPVLAGFKAERARMAAEGDNAPAEDEDNYPDPCASDDDEVDYPADDEDIPF